MILTGTPIQNNLKEMWALFDWTHQGTLLGTARTFGMEFDTPIWRVCIGALYRLFVLHPCRAALSCFDE